MSTIDRNWAWQRRGSSILLYEVDSDDNFIPPSLDITDGIQVEYISGDKVFVDSSGFSEDSSPDENSYINARDSVVYAIMDYVRSKLLEEVDKDVRKSEFYLGKFYQKFAEAERKIETSPTIVIPRKVYSIR